MIQELSGARKMVGSARTNDRTTRIVSVIPPALLNESAKLRFDYYGLLAPLDAGTNRRMGRAFRGLNRPEMSDVCVVRRTVLACPSHQWRYCLDLSPRSRPSLRDEARISAASGGRTKLTRLVALSAPRGIGDGGI